MAQGRGRVRSGLAAWLGATGDSVPCTSMPYGTADSPVVQLPVLAGEVHGHHVDVLARQHHQRPAVDLATWRGGATEAQHVSGGRTVFNIVLGRQKCLQQTTSGRPLTCGGRDTQ